MRLLSFLITVSVLAGAPAQAQTQAHFDRIDQLASFTLQAPLCSKVGFAERKNAAEVFSAALTAEARRIGLDPAVAGQMYSEAIDRRSRTFRIDVGATVPDVEADPTALRPWFLQHARRCQEIASDPLMGRVVLPPPGFDPEKAATDAADAMLEIGGMASWQTPAIQARGDLVAVAGECRSHIGAGRSDALFKRYGSTDNQRARAYYAKAFQRGLEGGLDLDATQCERAIKSFTAKAEAAATP